MMHSILNDMMWRNSLALNKVKNSAYMIKLIIALASCLLVTDISPGQWVTQYSSSPAQTISSLKFHDVNTGYHTTSLFNGSTFNIFRTTNGGSNYTSQNSAYTSQRFMAVWIIHPDTVFISGNYGKIIRTYNGGSNWVTVNSDTLIQYWGLQFVNSFTGFAAGSFGKIIKTTNRGENWSALVTSFTNALDGIFFINETTGYVGGSNIITMTTDAGANWQTQQGVFVSFETATAIRFTDANTGVYSTNAGRIVRTTNGGTNWNEVYYESGVAVWGLAVSGPGRILGCRSDGTVIWSSDSGVSWNVQSTPLTENLYEIDFPSQMTGYIGTWSGNVLKTTNGGLTYAQSQFGNVPAEVKLFGNFPNPFNPSTSVSFELPARQDLKLTIHDISGRVARVLREGEFPSGMHEVEWNAVGLSGGVYFIRLQSGDISLVKKAVLLK